MSIGLRRSVALNQIAGSCEANLGRIAPLELEMSDKMHDLLPGTRGIETEFPNPANERCPACESGSFTDFYKQEKVPVDSFRLVESREAGIDFPRGRLDLAVCAECGRHELKALRV